MATLSFEPLIPPALWLALAVAGVALLAWYGWGRPASVRRPRWAVVLALMAAGLALVLLVLLNPTWVEPLAPPAGKPLVTVLVDGSASMATADVGGQTRYRAATGVARAFAGELADRFDLRVATFAASLTPVDAADLDSHPPDGPGTDLAAALLGTLDQPRPQGQAIVLLSDGIHNAGGSERVLDAVRVARALASPVYTRTFGGDAEVIDLAVELRAPQELAYVGQKASVEALLRLRGMAGGRTTVRLVHDGKELERRLIALPGQDATEVRFEVSQEKPGIYRYEVRADAVPGEVSLVNNTAVLQLRVVDEPIRVLLLEGKPYWDAKFLMRTLQSDPSVELDSVVRVSANRLHHRALKRAGKPSRGGAAPGMLREEWTSLAGFAQHLGGDKGLRSYQVLVLGRDAEVFLTEPVLAQLRTWVVRDGGSLVCYRGQPAAQVDQRLAQLLPVRWAPAREARFHPSLTERGRTLHWFPSPEREPAAGPFGDLPTLATAARAAQPKPPAVVLATSGARLAEPENPVVTYQPYGTGRVVVLEGSGMWRWAFLPPEQQKRDDVYRSLWSSLLRWLVSSADLLPGQKLCLRSDKTSFAAAEPATATLLLREDAARQRAPAVELHAEGGGRLRSVAPVPLGDEPGVFRVVFGTLPEGRYLARVAGTAEGDTAGSTAFDVRNFTDEQLDLKARPDLMARIAHDSGGAVLEAGTPREMVARFREHLEGSRPPRVRRLSAWDRWWVLVGVIAVWGTAWAVRRSGGLV
jgi:hypothetical protein